MSATVFNFPDRMQTQWGVYEGTLRAAMLEFGANEQMISEVLSNIKDTYLKYAQPRGSIIQGASGEELLEKVSAWVKLQTEGLLSEILLREIELYAVKNLKPR